MAGGARGVPVNVYECLKAHADTVDAPVLIRGGAKKVMPQALARWSLRSLAQEFRAQMPVEVCSISTCLYYDYSRADAFYAKLRKRPPPRQTNKEVMRSREFFWRVARPRNGSAPHLYYASRCAMPSRCCYRCCLC